MPMLHTNANAHFILILIDSFLDAGGGNFLVFITQKSQIKFSGNPQMSHVIRDKQCHVTLFYNVVKWEKTQTSLPSWGLPSW